MSQTVTIARSTSGDLHAHSAGCTDLRKRGRYLPGESWDVEASSVRDVILDVYEPDCFLYDPDLPEEYATYRGDVRVFPCVQLPEDAA